MKYVLEYKNLCTIGWRKSENAPEEYDSLGELLSDIKNNDNKALASTGHYRIRKIPEQPEEQILE